MEQIIDEMFAFAQDYRDRISPAILMPPVDGETSDFGEFNKRLEAYKKSHQLSAGEKMVIKSLSEYSDYLKKEILEYSE